MLKFQLISFKLFQPPPFLSPSLQFLSICLLILCAPTTDIFSLRSIAFFYIRCSHIIRMKWNTHCSAVFFVFSDYAVTFHTDLNCTIFQEYFLLLFGTRCTNILLILSYKQSPAFACLSVSLAHALMSFFRFCSLSF